MVHVHAQPPSHMYAHTHTYTENFVDNYSTKLPIEIRYA